MQVPDLTMIHHLPHPEVSNIKFQMLLVQQCSFLINTTTANLQSLSQERCNQPSSTLGLHVKTDFVVSKGPISIVGAIPLQGIYLIFYFSSRF